MHNYQINELNYSIGARTLFNISHLQFNEGSKIGLVGRNGTGKSTLFQQITATDILLPKADVYLMPQFKTITTQSGGEQVQHYLDDAFKHQPDILLLDEPTANLDLSHVEKLEKRLARYQKTVIIISHDRTFLDNLVNTIWELEDGKITVYPGNYSAYLAQKNQKIATQTAAYDANERKKDQLQAASRIRAEQARRAVILPKQGATAKATDYFLAKQTKINRNVKAIDKRIEKLPTIKKPKINKPIKMTVVKETQLRGNTILRATHFDVTIQNRCLIKNVQLQVKAGDKIAITGDNQSGKTTLIRQLLQQPSAEGVYLNPMVTIGYFTQNIDRLINEQSVIQNVRSTSVQEDTMNRTVLARLGISAPMLDTPIAVLSGGERVKILLAKLMVSDANCLILDEPTNFLDLPSIEALQDLLIQYTGTLILISHDRQLVRKVTTTHYQIQQKQLINLANQTKPKNKQIALSTELMRLKLAQSQLINSLSNQSSPKLEIEFQEITNEIKHIESQIK